MYAYRSGPIAELAAQLKRGPIRLRIRQLNGIEFLLSVIESAKDYPIDFVTHALTGYRPKSDGALDSRLIDGASLQEDLVTLAEDLSEQADIPAENWPDPLFSVADLAKRFDVSTKTIFRWRRRGLVGLKFRFADRRVRVAFTDKSIRRFVAANADLVHRGSNFSQLTDEERTGIIARAQSLYEAGHKTVNAVARTVAVETGRAVETVRLILKNHDSAHPRAGIFNRPTIQVGVDDQRLAVWEAYVEGASIDVLSRRFGRPAAWLYRTITQMRARDLKVRRIEFLPSVDFEAPDAEKAILHAPELAGPYADTALPARVPSDLPPYLQQLFRLPLLSPGGEVALFRKLNYLKFRADQLRVAMDVETVSASELDHIEALLEEANRVKQQITQGNLRLVVSIAKRHLSSTMDLFELISDGNVSLMRAVDKFDYSRGYKFSTYASWAVMRNFARSVPEFKAHRDRYQTGRDELIDVAPGFVPKNEAENDFAPAVRNVIERMLGQLGDREQAILRHRFGLDDAQPQTLEQIGKKLGVSKERIRQLESRAMEQLRCEFSDEVKQLIGAG
ncbi:MAG: sigma-70 family RNA polymerase sigma factor [Phycisphaerales bacterium]|nr:sigma-70 family RNA polymerase sigma factor [Phycisphaerales bacterium]